MKALFNPSDHSYSLNDNQLISVTQLLKKHGLSPDYSSVPKVVLKAKSERGKLIHSEIDHYIKTGEVGFTQEFCDYLDLMEKLGLEPLKSEFIVNNDIIGGMCDLKARRKLDGKIFYIDYKSGLIVYKTACGWQLSFYEYFDHSYDADLLVFHLLGGKSKAIPIAKIPREELEKLIEAERRGDVLESKELIVNSELLTEIKYIETFIKNIDAQKKEAEAKYDKLKAELIGTMESQGVVKWVSLNGIKVTYVAPTQKETIDSKRLREELPDIASQYTKVSSVKANLRITIPPLWRATELLKE